MAAALQPGYLAAAQQLRLGAAVEGGATDAPPPGAWAADGGAASASGSGDATGSGAVSPAVAGALRQGVYCLLGALTPADLQHVHTVLGEGAALAGLRRAALADLKRDHERHHRFTGKM